MRLKHRMLKRKIPMLVALAKYSHIEVEFFLTNKRFIYRIIKAFPGGSIGKASILLFRVLWD